jgi:Cu/Ag efflux protein CusF
MRPAALLLGILFALAMGGAASAQWGGEGRGGHGHGQGDSSETGSSDQDQPHPSSHQPPPQAPDQVVITGVVTGLGPEPDRVTIAYGAVDALNWPAGTTPFVVTNAKLLDGITVGQRVRFKIESAHIYELDRVG